MEEGDRLARHDPLSEGEMAAAVAAFPSDSGVVIAK
jgi:hypothetical protein